MSKDEGSVVTLSCQCGHRIKAKLAGKDLQTHEFMCPQCGVASTLTSDQIAAIEKALAGARDQYEGAVREALTARNIFKRKLN